MSDDIIDFLKAKERIESEATATKRNKQAADAKKNLAEAAKKLDW